MARLPALVDALTQADGQRDRATIDNIARAVREDGLLPTTGAGHLAAHMSARNAADLLLAVNVMAPRGDAAELARQYRALRRRPSSSRGRAGALKELGEAETLGEAVEVLIARADEIRAVLDQWVDRCWANLPKGQRDALHFPQLYLELTSHLSARIAVLCDRGRQADHDGPDFECRYDLEPGQRPVPGLYAGEEPDRRVTVRVGLKTILLLHDTVFERGAETAAGVTEGASA